MLQREDLSLGSEALDTRPLVIITVLPSSDGSRTDVGCQTVSSGAGIEVECRFRYRVSVSVSWVGVFLMHPMVLLDSQEFDQTIELQWSNGPTYRCEMSDDTQTERVG